MIPPIPDISEDWASSFFGTTFMTIFSRLGKFQDTVASSSDLIKLLELPARSTVLDIPCGFGRFSSILQQYGFNVTGLDTSDYLLNQAQKINPGPNYIMGDMRHPPPGPYDAALNLWTSFGYYKLPSEDYEALHAWYNVLRPGGQLIMELTDLERAAYENGPTMQGVSYKINETNGVVHQAWIDWQTQIAITSYSINNETLIGRTRLYTQTALKEMLSRVGFVNVKFYGGFDKRPKGPSDRLVVHASTPKY